MSRPGASKSCRRNKVSFEELDVSGEISNISYLNWMKGINNYLVLLIVVGYGREGDRNDMETLASEKPTSILSCFTTFL
jgi:hypothetical protein